MVVTSNTLLIIGLIFFSVLFIIITYLDKKWSKDWKFKVREFWDEKGQDNLYGINSDTEVIDLTNFEDKTSTFIIEQNKISSAKDLKSYYVKYKNNLQKSSDSEIVGLDYILKMDLNGFNKYSHYKDLVEDKVDDISEFELAILSFINSSDYNENSDVIYIRYNEDGSEYKILTKEGYLIPHKFLGYRILPYQTDYDKLILYQNLEVYKKFEVVTESEQNYSRDSYGVRHEVKVDSFKDDFNDDMNFLNSLKIFKSN